MESTTTGNILATGFENDMSQLLSACMDIIEQLLLRMGLGYLEEKEVLKDYEGLASLLRETKLLFKESGRVVTVAYYPDTRQAHFRE